MPIVVIVDTDQRSLTARGDQLLLDGYEVTSPGRERPGPYGHDTSGAYVCDSRSATSGSEL